MKCARCNGKGGYRQLTGFSEDDVAWDLCPECDGKGTVELEKKERKCVMCGKVHASVFDDEPFCSWKCEKEYEDHVKDFHFPGYGEFLKR
ncbi:hypothetical protein ACSU6B_23080 [Neobacillus sp. C211]|uniref:hypothetical protein n=1 Tax=unclassified Neobacillus TaxID=2675272 RepID=UPI00397ACD59